MINTSTIALDPRDDGRVDVRIEARATFPAKVIEEYVALEIKEDAPAVK